MKKSVLKFVFIVMLCIGSGFIIGELVSILKMDSINFFDTYNVIRLIGAFLCALIVSVTVHEMAHALYFRIHGIQIRLFAVFFLCLNHCSGKWKVLFYPNSITILGGLVIPDLPPISNKEVFEKVRKIYYRDLLIAPIVSGLLAVISIITLFLFNSNTNNSGVSIIATFLLMFIFTNLTIFLSSFIKTENIFGDFPAYYVYKNNDKIAKLQICQYLFFSDSWKNVADKSKWIIDELKNMIANQSSDNLDMIDLQLLDWIVQMDFISEVKLDKGVLDLMSKITNSKNDLFSFPSSESRDVLFYHIIYSLLKYNRISISEARIKIDSVSPDLLQNHPSKEYYNQLTNHFLGNSDNTLWLKKHINPNASYSLLKIFPAIEYIEMQLINKLKE